MSFSFFFFFIILEPRVQRDLGRKAEGVTFLQPSDEPGPLSALKKSQGSISLPARCYPRLKIKIELRRKAGGVTFLDPSDESGPNLAHVRQSRPDSGLGFMVKVLKMF